MNLEIWFLQQNEVSVFLESPITDPDEEHFSETCLFALYAARQIVNLRAEGHLLADVLRTIDTSAPILQVEELLGGVRVSSPRDRGGRKGFTAELRLDKRDVFKLHPHGFGMLGKGLSYYSPTSALALLSWLLVRRKDDSVYQRALSAAAENVGIAGTQGTIKMTSQQRVAMQAAAEAWDEAREA